MQNQFMDMVNKIAEDTYAATKKMNELNVQVMEKLFEQQSGVMSSCMESAQESMDKLSSVKDYQEAVSVQNDMLRECGEKMLSNYKNVVSLMGEARDDFSGMVEENMKTAEENVKQATEAAKKAS